jgi:ribosomal protein S12 methylthiotransferase accessory factor
VIDVERLPKVGAGPFPADRKILWIEGHDLLANEAVWLPYELVHTDYTLPLPPGSGALAMSSNGLASGNHPLEAIAHAVSELVERDATTLWTLGAAQEDTRLGLETVDDPACRAVLDRFQRAGVTAGVWETTTDVGIAAFQCAILDRSTDPLRRLGAASGMGCHAAREIALLRALTEAAQARLTLIAGAREETGGGFYAHARSPEHLAALGARLAHERQPRRFADAPTFAGDTFEADLAASLARLSAAGIAEVAVVDLSRDDLGIPVVRVVIPGLETMHEIPGYVPGGRARALLARRRGRA